MAKKIKFESFRYRFLIAAHQLAFQQKKEAYPPWVEFINDLKFFYDKGDVLVKWDSAKPDQITTPLKQFKLYLRGDTEEKSLQQHDGGLMLTEDPVKLNNDHHFKKIVTQVAMLAGYQKSDSNQSTHARRIDNERDFHDAWANSEDISKINVRAANEVCTAPEMRYITKRLGNLKGKRLLDVGCGLGEASVYFALQGANVTSSDLSQGMLDATTRLAKAHGVEVSQHIASAEDMNLSADDKFDIIYTGNLLHHVDIEETISRILPHLSSDGVFVSWDPLAYNPAINLYRTMAKDVRTPDEHPLRWSDIKLFSKYFNTVETKYFWLTTLIIFILMVFAQRRNPNKERFWKVVVEEGDKWSWLYKPLEKIDSFLLKFFPPLRLLCWNVVIVCKVK